MSRIFWDTNLFVYLFEDYKALSKMTEELRKKMLARGSTTPDLNAGRGRCS